MTWVEISSSIIFTATLPIISPLTVHYKRSTISSRNYVLGLRYPFGYSLLDYDQPHLSCSCPVLYLLDSYLESTSALHMWFLVLKWRYNSSSFSIPYEYKAISFLITSILKFGLYYIYSISYVGLVMYVWILYSSPLEDQTIEYGLFVVLFSFFGILRTSLLDLAFLMCNKTL